jgi:hypothetical protein
MLDVGFWRPATLLNSDSCGGRFLRAGASHRRLVVRREAFLYVCILTDRVAKNKSNFGQFLESLGRVAGRRQIDHSPYKLWPETGSPMLDLPIMAKLDLFDGHAAGR